MYKKLSDIEIGKKYWTFEESRGTRLLEVLVVGIVKERNRVIIDIPYMTETLVEVLPQHLYMTELEAINSVFRDDMYYHRERVKKGYKKGHFDFEKVPLDKRKNRRVEYILHND